MAKGIFGSMERWRLEQTPLLPSAGEIELDLRGCEVCHSTLFEIGSSGQSLFVICHGCHKQILEVKKSKT